MGREEVPVYHLSIVAQILKHNSFITMHKITKLLKERYHGFSVAQKHFVQKKENPELHMAATHTHYMLLINPKLL